jgi:Ca2+-binding RTX toxin-like protein
MSSLVLWGPERLLNSASPSGEVTPSIEAFPDGSYVAVWALGLANFGPDTDGAVYARLFNADGTPKGPEFLVNSTMLRVQKAPQVTILNNGRFVVTWEDNSQDGTVGTQIRAQIFNADGSVFDRDGDGLKNEQDFVVNTIAAGSQVSPTVTALSNGGFVVGYRSPQGIDEDIMAQAFDADGNKLGNEVTVNLATANPQRDPVIAGLSGNRYVALWVDSGPADDPGAITTVRGRIMSADGTSGGAEFLVPSSRGSKQEISVTELTNGKFIVSWTHFPGFDGHGGSDGSSSSIKAQIFNADGTLYRSEFLVNTPTMNFQKLSSVTALPNGGFAIAYIDTSAGQSHVRVALFDQEGGRSLADILVGPPSGSTVGTKAVITTLGDGRLFVTWDENGTSRADDVSSIRGQIIDPRSTAVTLAGTAGNDDFYGTVYNDMLGGGEGADKLAGDLGNDTLAGGKGADELNGGRAGVAAGADGTDFASYANAETGVVASLLANGSNTGEAAGDIYISIEGLIGSAHADQLSGDNNANTLSGGGGNDQLFGNDGADLLEGGEGEDALNGGVGADILKGGAGNDTYHVDNASDKVEEGTGEGDDTVIASVTYALNAEAEIEVLRAQAGATTIGLTGNGFGNKIYGNDGANELNGGGGTDTLEGGLGDDVYVLDDAGDIVTENAGELTGYDTIAIANNFAGGTYRLTDYANIEAFKALDGAGKIDLIGNDIANKLAENTSDNVLEGRGGNDEIDGGGGVNTAVFTGVKAEYTITKNAGNGTYTVADNVQARDGTDLLKNVRFLRFSDGILDLEQAVPALSISATNAAKSEGDAGTTEYVFTVTRDTTSGESTVDWTLSGLGGIGAAILADFDGPTSGTLTFADGQREKTIILKVKGDKDVEGHEAFTVSLSNAANATIATNTAKGVIINDDAVPMLSISAADAAKIEGDSGYTEYTFTISRSSGDATSSVRWTVAGTGEKPALPGEFDVLTDVVTFAKDEVTKTIRIRVKADTEVEGDETFSVALSNPTDATIGVGSAIGTIIDDDVLNLAPTNIRLTTGGTTVVLDENKGAGTVVATVTADDDGGTPALRYSLVTANNNFEIDEITGQIRVKSGADLNFEGVKVHTLSVRVRDLNGAGLDSVQDITINLADVNEAPVLGAAATAVTIGENAALGDTVASFTLDDADAGENFVYEILGVPAAFAGAFAVDAANRKIVISDPSKLSVAGTQSFTLKLQVKDKNGGAGSLSDSKEFAVTIQDIPAGNIGPENIRLTTGEAEAYIRENLSAGQTVAHVMADDNGPAGELRYYLAENAYFVIDERSGEIKVKGGTRLNYEDLPDGKYTVAVTVKDLNGVGGAATRNIVINIDDVNEAATSINFTDQKVIKAGATLNGDKVVLASAVDPDTKEMYRDNLYLFANGTDTHGIFTIDVVTGQITTNRAVTSAYVGDHLLKVVAYDAQDKDLARTVSYTVTVVAADNQVPTITGVVAAGKGEAGADADAGTFVIFENEGAGVVADVNAADGDGDTLSYTLAGANGDYNGLLSIAADGRISITDPAALNLNADKDYVLTVQVSDGNGGTDTETVTIRVKNVIPANPAPSALLLNGGTEARINEFEALNGVSLGFVSVSDPGDSLRYSLVDNGGGLFAINESTGQVVVVGGLNYEQAASHLIKVRATDSAGQFVDNVFTILVNDQWNLNKRGKSKNDKMNGSALDDILKGGTKNGKDTIKGLDGDDKLYGEGGNDKVYGGNGIDFVRGDAGNDTVKGDAGNDKLYGGSGNDKAYGGAGDDKVYGDAGNDTLKGDAGSDTIYGGAGNDKLYGGAGQDVFVFNKKPSEKSNLDKIMDFNVKDDTIWLDNKVFTKLGKAGSEAAPAALNKNFFRVGDKAKDRNDYIVYDKKKGILYYDADGSGKKAAVEIATVKKGLKLTADDFFII